MPLLNILVHFRSGTYWGYQFDPNGNVTGSKSYTIGTRGSGARANARGPIPNRAGTWLHMSSGIWGADGGYWMLEDIIDSTDALSQAKLVDVVVSPPPPGQTKPWDQYGNGAGAFKKDFTKPGATLGPEFRVTDWPDDHIGGGGQWMTVFNRFRHAPTHQLIHDGYLDLWALRRQNAGANPLWDSDFVSTSQAGNGLTFGYGITRVWARFGVGHAEWPCAWLYDTTSWSADEIDWPEMLEGGKMVAHVLGKGAGGDYDNPIPRDVLTVFHEYKTERRASFTAFSVDGVEVARVNGTQSDKKLAILLDAKVGHPWSSSSLPDLRTPSPSVMQVQAVTFNP